MKKLLAVALVAGFMAAVMAPGAFAFGDCAGKTHGGTTTADQPKPSPDSA